eukprot:7385663-Prymnesium_polylepis.1
MPRKHTARGPPVPGRRARARRHCARGRGGVGGVYLEAFERVDERSLRARPRALVSARHAHASGAALL